MLLQPPPTIRMANGQIVPAQHTFDANKEHKKFLIVLQYYAGDMADMEEVANIICDLERVRNKDADIMLFGRFDAPAFPEHVINKLRSKFDKVHLVTCRSKDGKTYPFASNCMFYDLVTLLGQYTEWNSKYFAFINLESDCVPVHPGWIRELITDFKVAQINGKHAIGHIHSGKEAPIHMNGVGVYAIDIFFKVPGGRLGGGNLSIAYDLFQAPNILPIAHDTPLIQMEYRRPTITAEDLFKHHKKGVEPALFHGVKDASAREAVRAKHITFSQGNKDLSRVSIFTYLDTSRDVGHGESNEEVELWKQAALSRGWNPVVLRLMDASRHPKFNELVERVNQLPYSGSKLKQRADFIRWLALDMMGGGFMIPSDSLVNVLTPDRLTEKMKVRRDRLAKFIQDAIDYVASPEDKSGDKVHVTDESVSGFSHDVREAVKVADIGANEFRSADIIDFSERALRDSQWRAQRKVDVMREYLRGGL